MLTKPTYVAEAELFVAIQSSGSVQELQQGNTFTQARVQSYVQTVDTPIVLQPAITSLGLDLSPEILAKRIKASSNANTVLIKITAEDSSAAQSASIAKAVADSLIAAVDTLEKPRGEGLSPVRLSIVKPPVAPSMPTSPNTELNLITGLLTGLAMGIAAAIARKALDSRIRNEADLRAVTSSPILGGIAFDQDAVRKPLLTQVAHQSPRAESFRQLRTNVQFANAAGSTKSVLVTSSVPGEGKSTTSTNLAIALAQAGLTVCLVDADLRRPMVHEYLGLDRNAGLTTVLAGQSTVNNLLQCWGDGSLYVLTSGQIPPNPSELLGSGRMKSLITELEDHFDAVIIDAPPLLPVTDAAVLSQHVGGVVIVAGVQRLKTHDLERSLRALLLVGSTVLGTVLNQLPKKGQDAYSYGYYAADESTNGADSAQGNYGYSKEPADGRL